MSSLTWIHLSDWHYGEPEDVGVQDAVRDALIQDVKYRLNRTYHYEQPGGRPPIKFRLKRKADLLFFSGDATFRGNQANFTGATRLLQGIGDVAGIPKERVFVTPGNHDLYRPGLEMLPQKLRRPLYPNADISQLDPDTKALELLRKPFAGFREFSAPYAFGGEEVTAMKSDSLADSGIKYTISAFNSALYCGRKQYIGGQWINNDYGSLIVAQRSTGLPETPEDSLSDKIPHVKIGLIHHPFHWLHPNIQSDTQADLIRNFHFLLMGHEHEPRMNWVSQGNGEAFYIPAGATYQQDRVESDKMTRPLHEMGIAYNIVHIDFKLKMGFVILRLYRLGKDKVLKFHQDHRDKVGWPQGIFLLDHLPGCVHPEWPTRPSAGTGLLPRDIESRSMSGSEIKAGTPVVEELPNDLPLRSVVDASYSG